MHSLWGLTAVAVVVIAAVLLWNFTTRRRSAPSLADAASGPDMELTRPPDQIRAEIQARAEAGSSVSPETSPADRSETP